MQMRNVISKYYIRSGAHGRGWYYRALDKIKNQSELVQKPYDYAIPDVIKKQIKRPEVFIEFQIGEETIGKMIFELAKDVVPKTCDNFIKLCQNEYINSKIYNITKNTYIIGGDYTLANGRGGSTNFFHDENFALQFTERGVLGMANAGKNKNGSQFFISLNPLPHLNGRNMAFGKMINGNEILQKIENIFAVQGKPTTDIIIKSCGLVE